MEIYRKDGGDAGRQNGGGGAFEKRFAERGRG